jgi:MFS superfamily sulfate permease-like transporter
MGTSHKFQWPTMFSGFRGFTWANFTREISAGITLAALIIPLNIGYAQVAGLPPVIGLYAGIIPLAIFAIFTSSRHVVGSPDAPIAAILGAALIGFAPIGDPLRVQYALALALMCGLLFFVFWFFRLAFLANFLSRAVLAGFITGLGIEVLTNQIRRILGASHIIDGSGLAAIAQQLHGAMATSVGMTSVASGFTGSLVSGPSASRTAAMDAAGSRTQLSSLAAAVTVALVMVFFTKELAYLPIAALADVVASAVLNLIEVEELKELWRMRRSEFWVAAVCLLGVLVFGPSRAVVIAFLLATIDLLRRAARPSAWVLREAPDRSHFVPQETEHASDPSGILIYRFGAPLYFANATFFEEEVEKLITQSATPVKWFVLDAEAMVDIDTTGEEALHQVLAWLSKRGVTVALSRANQPTSALLARYHLL